MTNKIELPSSVYDRLADKQVIARKSRRIVWTVVALTTWLSFIGLFLYSIFYRMEYLWWDIPLGIIMFFLAFGDTKE